MKKNSLTKSASSLACLISLGLALTTTYMVADPASGSGSGSAGGGTSGSGNAGTPPANPSDTTSGNTKASGFATNKNDSRDAKTADGHGNGHLPPVSGNTAAAKTAGATSDSRDAKTADGHATGELNGTSATAPSKTP